MQQQISPHELYLRALHADERSFVLAGGVQTEAIPVLQLHEGSTYLTRATWGKDHDDPTLPAIRRGAGVRHNRDQGVFALHNKGIYSLFRRELHVLNGEMREMQLLDDDIGMLRIAKLNATLVRAKDPASQEAYRASVRLPSSTSPFTRNELKLKGARMVAKALSEEDSLGRPNAGRLLMLFGVGIPAFKIRRKGAEAIIVFVNPSAAACAHFIDAVIGITYDCLSHVSKFRRQVLDGKTWDGVTRRELASRMRAFADLLCQIDALPFRHALTFAVSELRGAADLVENDCAKQAADILAVTQQSMLLQLKLNDLQEQAALFSFWEKGVTAPTKEQLTVADEELARLHKEINGIDERNFTNPVKKDICEHIQIGRECLAVQSYDQVYEALEYGLEAH